MRIFVELDSVGNIKALLSTSVRVLDFGEGVGVIPARMFEVTGETEPSGGWVTQRLKNANLSGDTAMAVDFEPQPPEPEPELDPNSTEARLSNVENMLQQLLDRTP